MIELREKRQKDVISSLNRTQILGEARGGRAGVIIDNSVGVEVNEWALGLRSPGQPPSRPLPNPPHVEERGAKSSRRP